MSSLKSDLRGRGLRARDAIDPALRTAFAERIALVSPALLADIAPSGETLVVALYSAIGSEPDVMALAGVLHGAGFALALPVDWSPGTPLVYRRWVPGDRLAIGPMGIAEPLPEAPACEPDVLFMPVAAFDLRGYRIGYGAGNVDRTLTDLRSRKPVRAIGLGYAAQEELLIPNDPHDEPLDTIVTDRGILICRP